MKNNLPSYSQAGWGGPLNAYLSRLNSNILSIQKQIDVLQGDSGTSLIKYAGSGLTENNTVLYFGYHANQVDYENAKNETDEQKKIPFITKPVELKVIEGKGDLFTKTITLRNGNIYLSASLTNATGKKYSLQGNSAITFRFLKAEGEPMKPDENQVFTSAPVPGTYEIIIKEILKEGTLKLIVTAQLCYAASNDGNKPFDRMNRWIDPDHCRIGFLTVLSSGQKIFTPAPSICTATAGEKINYFLTGGVGHLDMSENAFIPKKYDYLIEGGDYFEQSLAEGTIPQALLPRFKNTTTFEVTNYMEIADTAPMSVNVKALSEFKIAELENGVLYIVYVNNSGIPYLRKIGIDTSNITDTMNLCGLQVPDFSSVPALQPYMGLCNIEVCRFLKRANMPIIYSTTNYNMGTPVQMSESSKISWDRLGIKPERANPEFVPGCFHISPIIGTTEETSTAVINLSQGISTNISDNLPHIMTYNSVVKDDYTVTGNTDFNPKLILKQTSSGITKLTAKSLELNLSDSENTPSQKGSFTINDSNMIYYHDSDAPAFKIVLKASAEEKNNLNFDGNIVITNGTLTLPSVIHFTSDRRYKENIKEYSKSALLQINALPIYEYNLINDNKTTIGIMAQDLQIQEPLLVHQVSDGTRKDKLVIDETKLVFLCMKAIQELSNEIKELKKER